VKAKECGDVINTSSASASASLVFVCSDAGGALLHASCDEFIEWLLRCMQSDMVCCDSLQLLDDDMQLLLLFAQHEGLRSVLLHCSLLPPFICLCFRLYFDLRRQGDGEEAGVRAQLWVRLLLLLLFKLCNLDDEGPQLVLSSLQSSGADDFAYVVHSLMQVAANNLSCSAPLPPLPSTPTPPPLSQSPTPTTPTPPTPPSAVASSGFMSKCAAVLSKDKECVGCVAVDLCSMLCCCSPESVSYAILSQALKPSLVMNLTLLLFQRLSSPTLQHEHERLAVSWLVLPPSQRTKHGASALGAQQFLSR
jgi:hypothetical protein